MKKDDFAVCSLGICGVLKGIEDFLEGEDFARFLISDFPDVPVGAASDLLYESVFLEDVVFDLICHYFYFN